MEVFRTALERMGFRVLAAKTGHEALKLATSSSEKIDVAILDILLPDTDGRSLYPSLIQARPGLKVIVSSGYSVEGPAQEILDAGAQAFLPKPFSLVDFREALRKRTWRCTASSWRLKWFGREERLFLTYICFIAKKYQQKTGIPLLPPTFRKAVSGPD